jgi:hypothetical protein
MAINTHAKHFSLSSKSQIAYSVSDHDSKALAGKKNDKSASLPNFERPLVGIFFVDR